MGLIVDPSHHWFLCASSSENQPKTPVQMETKDKNNFKFFIPANGLERGLEIDFQYDPANVTLKGTYTWVKDSDSAKFTAIIEDRGRRIQVFPKGYANREIWVFERDDVGTDVTSKKKSGDGTCVVM
jgi:hypothetical protein